MKENLKRAARFLMRKFVQLRLLWLFPGNPRVLESYSGKASTGQRRLCVFASFSRKSKVEEYVYYNLIALNDVGFDIVFVTTSEKFYPADLQRLQNICLRTLRRRNTGYDFGSWKAGLFYAGIDYLEYDQLVLTNDSYYGPLYPWSGVLAQADSDIFGVTDSHGMAYHLMSYFVLYNRRALHSAEFRRYWRGVRMVPTILKTLIIYAYEVGMSQKFQQAGYSISAWCRESELFQHLPSEQHLLGKTITVHHYWRELIERVQCPILKTDIFWRVFRGDAQWKEVLERTGYDLRLIERHQASLEEP